MRIRRSFDKIKIGYTENSMNWHLVTYADENFVEQQKYLHQIHKEGFVHQSIGNNLSPRSFIKNIKKY